MHVMKFEKYLSSLLNYTLLVIQLLNTRTMVHVNVLILKAKLTETEEPTKMCYKHIGIYIYSLCNYKYITPIINLDMLNILFLKDEKNLI